MTALDSDIEKISRRRFLARILKAGTAIAATGALGSLLYDPWGPSGEIKEQGVTLPDFSITGMGGKIAIVSGSNRRATVAKAIDAIGGIGAFIKQGDIVLLKVNAAFASPPILSATTHPDLLSEVITLCFRAGASEVRVTDNPINDPVSCFQLSGIARATEESGGKLFFPRGSYFRPTTVKNGELIRNWPILYVPFEGVTKLIGLAPLKDHNRSSASMALKNWYGLLGGRRNTFHQDIHNIIKELAMLARPTFVILDGTTTMMTNGPTGGALSDLKQTNLMIASTDHVAADAFGCTVLGRNISDLPFIRMSAEAGAGTADYAALKPVRISTT
jgi:uncharacterized protein (DUF362 family)